MHTHCLEFFIQWNGSAWGRGGGMMGASGASQVGDFFGEGVRTRLP